MHYNICFYTSLSYSPNNQGATLLQHKLHPVLNEPIEFYNVYYHCKIQNKYYFGSKPLIINS